jgi:hypothetical protein
VNQGHSHPAIVAAAVKQMQVCACAASLCRVPVSRPCVASLCRVPVSRPCVALTHAAAGRQPEQPRFPQRRVPGLQQVRCFVYFPPLFLTPQSQIRDAVFRLRCRPAHEHGR